ncbi:MAG TPA: hypothetical protein VLG40_00805 [Candidatus Saccharimonas sp.]|nr:hypothetical protein [Candidatus Saccharimonas sp.]
MLRGKTRPERAGWFIWFVLGAVMFAAQLAKGGNQSLWIILAHIVGNGLIFLLSFKFGDGSFSKRDKLTLAVAAGGIALWGITREPTLALLVSIAVDALGAALITIKAYKKPYEETLVTWVLGTVAGVCSILAVQNPASVLIIYPIYAALNSGVIVVAIVYSKWRMERDYSSTDDEEFSEELEPAE